MSASDIRVQLSNRRIPLENLERLARALGCLPEARNARDDVWRRRLIYAINNVLDREARVQRQGMTL